MPVADLIDRSRASVHAHGHDPAVQGLARLSGGMNHGVFTPLDDPGLVVKVFRTGDEDEPEREWNALVTLTGTGLAPEPVQFAAGRPAIVVMTRLSGAPLAAAALATEHAHMIGSAHRLVHQAKPRSRRPTTHSGVRAARAALMLDERQETRGRRDDTPHVVASAWTAAREWMGNADLQHLLSSDQLRYSRGDPNLANYLWTNDQLALIDWEHSGDNDPALELADMAEHASTRDLGDEFWIQLANATELTQADRTRFTHGRRLMACFWLVLIEGRHREGLPTTVTVEEQARRTLPTLEG